MKTIRLTDAQVNAVLYALGNWTEYPDMLKEPGVPGRAMVAAEKAIRAARCKQKPSATAEVTHRLCG